MGTRVTKNGEGERNERGNFRKFAETEGEKDKRRQRRDVWKGCRCGRGKRTGHYGGKRMGRRKGGVGLRDEVEVRMPQET